MQSVLVIKRQIVLTNSFKQNIPKSTRWLAIESNDESIFVVTKLKASSHFSLLNTGTQENKSPM